MARIIAERVAGEIDGDFVVFVIGMRVNAWWKPWKWVPTALAMPRMVKELRARPESGFLGAMESGFLLVQYWRSFAHLEAYARDQSGAHWPAWTAFNRRMKRDRGAVGIWHETYMVPAGAYEAFYSGMPAQGLGRAGRLVPATGKRDTARGRASADMAEKEPVVPLG